MANQTQVGVYTEREKEFFNVIATAKWLIPKIDLAEVLPSQVRNHGIWSSHFLSWYRLILYT